jgi:hypothetical protein
LEIGEDLPVKTSTADPLILVLCSGPTLVTSQFNLRGSFFIIAHLPFCFCLLAILIFIFQFFLCSQTGDHEQGNVNG